MNECWLSACGESILVVYRGDWSALLWGFKTIPILPIGFHREGEGFLSEYIITAYWVSEWTMESEYDFGDKVAKIFVVVSSHIAYPFMCIWISLLSHWEGKWPIDIRKHKLIYLFAIIFIEHLLVCDHIFLFNYYLIYIRPPTTSRT
jgi:hypothetical protein